MPALVPAPVRRDGFRICPDLDGCAESACWTAVDWRGGDEGQRADPRGAPAVEGFVAALCRQCRGARDLFGYGRCHRLRRIHGQRRPEAERGPRGDGRGAARRGAAEHVFGAGGVVALASRLSAISQARGLFGIRRCPADGCRRSLYCRPWPFVSQSRPQRRRHGVAFCEQQCPHAGGAGIAAAARPGAPAAVGRRGGD